MSAPPSGSDTLLHIFREMQPFPQAAATAGALMTSVSDNRGISLFPTHVCVAPSGDGGSLWILWRQLVDPYRVIDPYNNLICELHICVCNNVTYIQ